MAASTDFLGLNSLVNFSDNDKSLQPVEQWDPDFCLGNVER